MTAGDGVDIPTPRVHVRSKEIVKSSVLTAAGAAIALAGIAVGLREVATVFREWVGGLDESPADMARARWRLATTAAIAAADAWNRSVAAQPPGNGARPVEVDLRTPEPVS